MNQLRVRNIDVLCDEHADGFGVYWDGKLAMTIAPGQSMVVEEYLGRQFAKKLTEHMLLDSPNYQDNNLTENAQRRIELESEIIEESIIVDDPAPEVIPKGHGHVVDPLEQ